MATQKAAPGADLWFVARIGSGKLAELAHDPHAAQSGDDADQDRRHREAREYGQSQEHGLIGQYVECMKRGPKITQGSGRKLPNPRSYRCFRRPPAPVGPMGENR